jgi:hypothetical protein
LRTIWNVVGIATVLAVVSFGVNVAEGRLMQRLAPRTAAELSLSSGPPVRPTDTPCAYVGPPAADACDSAASFPNPCAAEFQQVSHEAYDACLVYREQQLAQAQEACAYVARDSLYDACVRGQQQELATQVAQRARANARILIPGTPLPCPGYDPSLPAPDSCPPSTPHPH